VAYAYVYEPTVELETRSLISGLAAAPALVSELVQDTPESNRKRRPAPTRWSVHEHVCHLAAVHPLFFERLDLMVSVRHPRIVAYDPPQAHQDGALLELDLDAELRRFTADRARLVQRLSSLSAEDWNRTGEHPEFAPYSVAIMFRHVLMHDMLHAYRIEELALKTNWS
jgi:uncharacterized damage-inducible protein DinB